MPFQFKEEEKSEKKDWTKIIQKASLSVMSFDLNKRIVPLEWNYYCSISDERNLYILYVHTS